MTMEMHATIKGHVQGVFFRATVKKHADFLQINGFVANLANGDVAVCAQGEKTVLEKFIKMIRTDPGKARIDDISLTYQNSSKTYQSFEIHL